ncbi:MAG: HAMP domain-containing histidine kinase [Deltaproteobacteria bacterium]|nr:HAMP domain-containing histidine kinase [Deltaproteobacteria bacterium]MBI3295600.1 HAMP domain-containing histidine kinase [Deltaproteobacteria bacterium]
MKRRFIAISLAFIVPTVLVVTLLHFHYLRSERLRLIDRQIEAAASVVLSSNMTALDLEDIDEMDEYFHDLLGSLRANKILLLRNKNGLVIFQSRNAEWLPDNPPEVTSWQTIEAEGHQIRLFGVAIPQIGKTLQIGMVLDEELSYWRSLDTRFTGFIFLISVIVLGVAWGLATLLLKPLNDLTGYLSALSNRMEREDFEKGEIPELKAFVQASGSDEFAKLLTEVNRYNRNVRQMFARFRGWTAQLAHQIKTPLTVMRNSLEMHETLLKRGGTLPQDVFALPLNEIDGLSNTITGFLEWASFVNTPPETKIYAVHLKEVAEALVNRMRGLCPERELVLTAEEREPIFADPQHVEWVLQNLLTNAIDYSPKGSRIEVEIRGPRIVVRDRGPGIPDTVMKRLGEPFNQGANATSISHGLGLAWVVSVCRQNDWKMDVRHTNPGTEFEVTIPSKG